MNAQLHETLLKLKPEIDALWTEDGLPRLDVLSKALGFEVTRDYLDKEAPGFSRATAATFGADAVAAAADGQGPAQEPSTDIPEPPTAPDHKEADLPQEDRQERLEALRREVADAAAAAEKAKRAGNEAAAELARLEANREDGEDLNAIYQRRQHEIRMERAEALEAVRATGLNMSIIQQAIGPAPVDAARMAMKRAVPVLKPQA
ncbi:coil containing protein [Stenotrophomonas phage BUCT626]|uniref:Coil containing protein n=1 Tax=Stenotrophomonas phage BUCT626 TaxID=2860376 RepID=A0AC61NMK6_9CAUD|nr:coil containing protein [Stenotrophomonas phage BUCT626]QYC96706.1 coil containing protein [Stenotrophomonas phage BUCT626]